MKAENVVYGCDNYLNFAKRITCDQCSPGLVFVNGQCLVDSVQEQCENGTGQQEEENGKKIVSCSFCNIRNGYFAVDTKLPPLSEFLGTQRQICKKYKLFGSKTWILIILAVLIVVGLLVYWRYKKMKTVTEEDLKTEMVTKNQL